MVLYPRHRCRGTRESTANLPLFSSKQELGTQTSPPRQGRRGLAHLSFHFKNQTGPDHCLSNS